MSRAWAKHSTPGGENRAEKPVLRNRIATRLLAAFLVVSILPIGILGYLSWHESRNSDEPAAGLEAHAESGDMLFGVSVATVELVVAGASLVLSVLMALLVARTIVRPLQSLQGSMKKVERGEGTLGKLVNDESLYFTAKDSLKKVGKGADQLREQGPLSVIGLGIQALGAF
jgi:methyl-accepting chemotaxis protein